MYTVLSYFPYNNHKYNKFRLNLPVIKLIVKYCVEKVENCAFAANGEASFQPFVNLLLNTLRILPPVHRKYEVQP